MGRCSVFFVEQIHTGVYMAGLTKYFENGHLMVMYGTLQVHLVVDSPICVMGVVRCAPNYMADVQTHPKQRRAQALQCMLPMKSH